MSNNFLPDKNEKMERLYRKIKQNIHSMFYDVEQIEMLANYLLEQSRFLECMMLVEKALKQHKNNICLTSILAECLYNIGNKNEAFEHLQHIIRLNPFDSDCLLALATLYEHDKQIEKAIDCYQKMLRLNVENKGEIYEYLALANKDIAKDHQALFYFEKILTDYPPYRLVMDEATQIYIKSESFQKRGISFFKTLLQNQPYFKLGWYYLGLLYVEQLQIEKAINAFEYAILIDENFVDGYVKIAEAYIYKEDYKKAIDLLKSVLKKDSKNAESYCAIGECYEELKRYNEAMLYYFRAIQLDELNADAYMGLGVIYDELKNHKMAKLYIEKALVFDELNPKYWYLYACFFAKIGDEKKAKKGFRKAIILDNVCPDYWLDYAHFHYEKNRINRACSILEKAIKNDQNPQIYHYRLTMYCLENENINGAIEHLSTALSLSKGDEYKALIDLYPKCMEFVEVVVLIENYCKKQKI